LSDGVSRVGDIIAVVYSGNQHQLDLYAAASEPSSSIACPIYELRSCIATMFDAVVTCVTAAAAAVEQEDCFRIIPCDASVAPVRSGGENVINHNLFCSPAHTRAQFDNLVSFTVHN